MVCTEGIGSNYNYKGVEKCSVLVVYNYIGIETCQHELGIQAQMMTLIWDIECDSGTMELFRYWLPG